MEKCPSEKPSSHFLSERLTRKYHTRTLEKPCDNKSIDQGSPGPRSSQHKKDLFTSERQRSERKKQSKEIEAEGEREGNRKEEKRYLS